MILVAREFGQDQLGLIRDGFLASITDPSKMPMLNRAIVERGVSQAFPEVAVFIPGREDTPDQTLELTPEEARLVITERDQILKPH